MNGKGFVAWQAAGQDDDLAAEQIIPTVKHSVDHYQGQRDHLSPALIELNESMKAAADA